MAERPGSWLSGFRRLRLRIPAPFREFQKCTELLFGHADAALALAEAVVRQAARSNGPLDETVRGLQPPGHVFDGHQVRVGLGGPFGRVLGHENFSISDVFAVVVESCRER